MSFSTLTRKFWMSLTGLFLVTFLIVHLVINLLTLLPDPEVFNAASHFMVANPLIQIMQYVLAFGFIMHIATGIRLTYINKQARPVKYEHNRPGENSSTASRSMIYSGLLVMVFLCIHLYNYFYKMKFVGIEVDDYTLVIELFDNWIYTLIYVVAFILLGIHLNHGFQSAFQSLGANHRKYTPWIKKIGSIYSVVMAAGFSLIALYHFIF
jgi:succinate dehydrogenase / fumarate reductase cytochrome b subunit